MENMNQVIVSSVEVSPESELLNQIIETYREEALADVSAFLQIKSVVTSPLEGMPFGEGAFKALSFAYDCSEKFGFNSVMLDGYAAFADYGTGTQTLGILSHVDVVPEGTGWTFDPYGGICHEGKIYGRGALDDKGPLIASLYALRAVKESGIELKKKVRLLYGSNEETGMESIEYYLSKEKGFDLGFTPDAVFPVIHAEKGWMNLQFSKARSENLQREGENTTDALKISFVRGGVAANVVADQCEAGILADFEGIKKAYDQLVHYINRSGNRLSLKCEEGTLLITSYGKASHASRPEVGVNAISIMMEALGSLDLATDEGSACVEWYNKCIGMGYNGELSGCCFEDALSGKLTFNVGIIELTQKGFEMTVDIRYPVGSTVDEVVEGVAETFGESGFVIECLGNENPLFVPKEHELISGLMGVYQQFTGDFQQEPMVMGGLTYARSMPNVVAFGPLFPGEKSLAHQKDEHIGVEQLMKMIQIYAQAIVALANH